MQSTARRTWVFSAAMVAGVAGLVTGTASAQFMTCADEFRSGKQYFALQLNDKAVSNFAASVAGCPEKGEYRSRYAMALCQAADVILEEAFVKADTPERRAELLTKARGYYALAGAQFDSAGIVEDKKAIKKFASDNRDHYWVEHYNRALEFMKDDGKTAVAAIEFEMARLINPRDIKAYRSGAVALLKQDKRSEAALLVDQGLGLDPADPQLLELQGKIMENTANDLIRDASPAGDAAKAKEAEAIYDKLLAVRPEDANLLFARGLARMTQATAAAASVAAGSALPAEASEFFRAAAADFSKAAALTPADKDQELLLNCLFNQARCELTVGNFDQTISVAKSYLEYQYTDGTMWKLLSAAYIQKDEKEAGVSALMVSKSLEGGEIAKTPEAVKGVVKDVTEDAAAVLEQMEPPTAIYGYQEASSGNQIQTWIWPDKRTAMSFILNKKTGEATW